MPLPLPRAFYARPTLDVARDLIGKVLVHRTRTAVTSGMIVEVEAYIGEDDPACHAAAGLTARTAPLYGPPGVAYVYLNYGIHSMMNIVTEREGRPAAVLIRALEPLEGLAEMRRRRLRVAPGRRPARALRHDTEHASTDMRLCQGPGNLTVALGITLGHNRADVCEGRLIVEDRGCRVNPLVFTPRIGIRVATERPWRVAVAGHPAVSGPARLSVATPRGRRQNPSERRTMSVYLG